MYNGLLVVDKPQNFTSHDLCAKIRGIVRAKKIGHAGTLDPMATGVMLILLGDATFLSNYLEFDKKTYLAGLRLGITTDTEDTSGQVLSESQSIPSEEEVIKAVSSFLGESLQVPPMYSAIKTGGVRLYALARKGVSVEREPRPVTVYDISARKVTDTDYLLRLTVSKGTYVRTLCADIGKKLGCGAAMFSLRRLASGNYGEDRALSPEQVEKLHKAGELEVIPTDEVLSFCPKVTLKPEYMHRACHGAYIDRSMTEEDLPSGLTRVYGADGRFLMLAEKGKLKNGGEALFCRRNFVADTQPHV